MEGCKQGFIAAFAVASAIATALLGGWDYALQALLFCMAADYLSGIVVAAVFSSSPKSKTGALESRAGFLGLFRKGMMLLIVLIAQQLDAATGTDFVRDCAIFGFLANEVISIIENAGLMGVPVPTVLKKAVEVLKNRAEEKSDD